MSEAAMREALQSLHDDGLLCVPDCNGEMECDCPWPVQIRTVLATDTALDAARKGPP
jgi:hypothetical protein